MLGVDLTDDEHATVQALRRDASLRPPTVRLTIRKYDPDLIGFQELDAENQQTYPSALDESDTEAATNAAAAASMQ